MIGSGVTQRITRKKEGGITLKENLTGADYQANPKSSKNRTNKNLSL